jgi:hypothetical protein
MRGINGSALKSLITSLGSESIIPIMLRYIIIAGMCALSAYQRHKAPKTLVHEITGNTAQRVADVSSMLTENKPLPTAIQEAHFVEEKTGKH